MRKAVISLGIILAIGFALILFIGNSNDSNDADQGVAGVTEQESTDVGLTQKEVESGLDLQANGANGIYVVNLLSGNFEGEVEGKVLTDTDCEADAKGISRCHNEIELDNQNKVTIVNPHNMQKNRCLSPDDTVRLFKNEEGKVIVEL